MNPSHFIYGEKIKVLFNDIMNEDESIDKFRKELFSIENFSPTDLCHKLDKSKKSFINLTDFSDFLSSHSIQFNQFSLRRLIRTYDKKGKFLIIYDDFTNIIKPRYQNNIIIQEETKRNEEEILIDIILSECKLIEKIGQQSIIIRNCKDFTTFEAFMLISKGQKYINIDDLKIFLNNDNINDNKLEWVIYRLDLDNDKQVSYEEFQDIFFPFQNHLKVGEIEETNIYSNVINDNNKDEKKNYSIKTFSNLNYDNIKYDYKLNNNIENSNENLKTEHLSDFSETIAKLTGSQSTPIKNINVINKDKNSSILPLKINFQEKKNLSNNNVDENSYKIISFRPNDNNDLNKNNENKIDDLKYNNYNLEKNNENMKYNINKIKLDNIQNNINLNYINSENDNIKNILVNNMENNTSKDNIKNIQDSNFDDKTRNKNISDLEDNENIKDLENNINYIKSNGIENSNDDIQSNGLENNNNNIQNPDLEDNKNNIQNPSLEDNINNIQNLDLEDNKNINRSNVLENKINYIQNNNLNSNSFNDLESNRIIKKNNLETNINNIEFHNFKLNQYNIDKNNLESNYNRIENNIFSYDKNNSQNYDFKNYKKPDYNYNIENKRMNHINLERKNNGNEFITNLTDFNKKFTFLKNNETPNENNLNNIEQENDEKIGNYEQNISERIQQIKHNESIKQSSQLTPKEIYRKPKNDFSLNMKNSPLKNIQNYQLNDANTNLNNSFSEKLKDSNKELKYYSEKRPYIRKQFENSDIFTSNEFTSPIKLNNYESQFIPQIETSIEENNVQKNYINYNKNNAQLSNTFNNEIKYNNKEDPFFSSDSFIPSYYLSSPKKNNIGEIFENELINQLIEFLSNIIEKKSVLESIKENLCLKDDITLEDLFYDFDISKQHEIKMEDFLQVCKNFGIFPTSDQIYLLFKKYDLDCDKVLNYTEFCQMILPIKKEYIIIISNRQINPLKNNEISSETKYMIKELIKGLINIETDLYEDRIKLKNKYKFSCVNAWNLIMKYSKNEKDLDKEGFKLFFEDNGYFYTKYEIEILFNDIDLDKNGKINYRNFAKIFLNI